MTPWFTESLEHLFQGAVMPHVRSHYRKGRPVRAHFRRSPSPGLGEVIAIIAIILFILFILTTVA